MDKVVIIPVDIMFPNARVHTPDCAREQIFSKINFGCVSDHYKHFSKNRAKSQTRALAIF